MIKKNAWAVPERPSRKTFAGVDCAELENSHNKGHYINAEEKNKAEQNKQSKQKVFVLLGFGERNSIAMRCIYCINQNRAKHSSRISLFPVPLPQT